MSSSNVRHSRGLLLNIARMMNEPDDSIFKDLDLVCRDGIVKWNKLLLAANSPVLCQALDPDDDVCSIVIPDVTASTVNSMLKCTVNPTVRSDTLSVNELEVMRLLGFSLLSSSQQSNGLQSSSQPNQEKKMNESKASQKNKDFSSCIAVVGQKAEESDPPEFPACVPVAIIEEDQIHENNEVSDYSMDLNPANATDQQPLQPERRTSKTSERPCARPFVCDDANCGMTFERRLHFERHMASHTKKANMVCELCGKVFYHEDNLKLHLSYHKDILQTLQCSHCNATLKGRRALKLHVDTVHVSKIECQFCQRKMSKRLLKRHLARKHTHEMSSSESGALFCHVCQRQFSSAQALVVHRRSHQGLAGFLNPKLSSDKTENVEEYVTCDVCGKLFASNRHFITHKRRCHLKDHETCPECGKLVKDLKQHKRLMHDKMISELQASLENEEKEGTIPRKATERTKTKTTCHVCGKDYQDNQGLARHLREVHAENRYECPLCGHFFPVRHSLERHMRNVHHPVKHECPFCGIAVIHLAVHLNSSHGLDATNAKEVAEARTGKSAARTDLTLDWVLQRKRYQQQLLNDKS